MTTVDYGPQLLAEYQARTSVWCDIQGHLVELYDTVRSYPRARVLELGVRWGTSTSALLAAVAQVEGHLWSVDIATPAVPGWWAGTGLWTLTVGNDTDPEVARQQPDEVDVLFIDTSHVYEQMLDELALYVPRVVPGGVVLCHDTELEAPDAARGQGPAYPVAAALGEFCEAAGLTWANRTGSYGLGVINIPEAA